MICFLNPRQLKTLGRKYRRALFESFGSKRYSRPGDLELDKKLESYLGDRGFFIEAGANDGFEQSNTYYLERFKGWQGILIEPIPELYQDCVRQRPYSKVFNCALIPSNCQETEITMEYAHLMSWTSGMFSDATLEEDRLERAQSLYNIKPYKVTVPARTLTSILDELQVTNIDFFSLDVEGYELNVLQGLDFNKYRPKYMLLEHLSHEKKVKIDDYISSHYQLVDKLTYRDYLYKCKG